MDSPHPPPPSPPMRFGGPFLWMGPRQVDIDNGVDDDGDDGEVDDDGDDNTSYLGSALSQFMERQAVFSSGKDDVYTGSLGFGDEGDACMYKVYPKLSNSCKDAISDLYDFREDYVYDNPMAMGAPASASATAFHYARRGHAGMALGFVTLLILGLYVTFKRREKSHQIRRVLDVIDGNPQLKQQVEELAGCEIPRHNSGWKAIRNLFQRGFRGILYVACIIFAAFAIAIVSLITSTAIVGAMSHLPAECEGVVQDDEECQGPSPFFALTVLFIVVAVNMYLCALLARAFRCWGNRNIDESDHLLSYSSNNGAGGGDGLHYVALSGTDDHQHSGVHEMGSVQNPAMVPTVVNSGSNSHSYKSPQPPQRGEQVIVDGHLVRAVPVGTGVTMI